MAKLKDIVEFLDNYLKTDDIKDSSWNGLQVEGKPEVKKIIFAVDAGIDTFKKAIEEKADLIIVHHGHFWKTGNPAIIDGNKRRIGMLYENKVSLYASHLPLDKHKEVGNNAQLLEIIGAKIKEEFAEHEGQSIGWIGELKKPMTIKEAEKIINSKLKTKAKILPFGKDIKRIAVCSGGGGYPTFFEALNKNVDLYLTGDAIEVYHATKDAKLNVIFAGHHTTETLGVKALSKIIKQKFKVETKFIDIPTGL